MKHEHDITLLSIILLAVIGIVIAIIMGITSLFKDDQQDFKIAKVKKEQITCQGWFKTYVIEPAAYIVYKNHIEANIMFVPRNLKHEDCNITEYTNRYYKTFENHKNNKPYKRMDIPRKDAQYQTPQLYYY